MREEKRVRCPRCGYEMPVFYSSKANCKGIWLKCKGRTCGQNFELKIKNGEQIR